MKKTDKPIRIYRDKNGALVEPGDIIRFDDGSTEEILLLQGDERQFELGVNASNEAFLERHPWCVREGYPLHQFNSSTYVIDKKGASK